MSTSLPKTNTLLPRHSRHLGALAKALCLFLVFPLLELANLRKVVDFRGKKTWNIWNMIISSSHHLTSMWFHDVPWRPHLQHIVTDDSSHNAEKCPRTQYCEENPNLSQSTNPWAPCASCVDLVKSLSSWQASEKGKLEKEDQPLPSTDLRHCDLRLKSAKIWMTSCQQKPFPYPIAQAALGFFAFKILKAPLASACPSLERRSLFQITGYKKIAILCFRSLLFGIANSVGTCATVRCQDKISMDMMIWPIKSTTKKNINWRNFHPTKAWDATLTLSGFPSAAWPPCTPSPVWGMFSVAWVLAGKSVTLWHAISTWSSQSSGVSCKRMGNERMGNSLREFQMMCQTKKGNAPIENSWTALFGRCSPVRVPSWRMAMSA